MRGGEASVAFVFLLICSVPAGKKGVGADDCSPPAWLGSVTKIRSTGRRASKHGWATCPVLCLCGVSRKSRNPQDPNLSK